MLTNLQDGTSAGSGGILQASIQSGALLDGIDGQVIFGSAGERLMGLRDLGLQTVPDRLFELLGLRMKGR